MRCRLCSYDKTLKEEWGCDKSTQTAVWIDAEGNEYFNCPLVFIPENVQVWYEEFSYQQQYGGAPSYRKQSRKWIEAMRLYHRFKSDYEKEAPGSGGEGQDLSVLKAKRNIEDAT